MNNRNYSESALPCKLSIDEERNCFINFNKLNREKIIMHNLRLVTDICNKYFSNSSEDINILISIGIEGLIKAVDNYNINKNNKFSTYATYCIRNEILMYFRKKSKLIDPILIEQYEDDDNLKWQERIKDTTLEDPFDKELVEEILSMLDLFEERKKEFVLLYFGFYGKPYTCEEIGKMYNVTKQYVSRQIRSVLKIIRRMLNINDSQIKKIK